MSKSLCGKKVLVVDDDQLVCEVVNKTLGKIGLECEMAGSGRDAANIIRERGEEFDLFVIDLVLPRGITGWDLVDIIKENTVTTKKPMIVLTGVFLSEAEIKKLGERVTVVLKKQEFGTSKFRSVAGSLLETV